MNQPVKYRGVAMEFGDRVLIVPPLSTEELETYAEQLDAMTNAEDRTFSFKTFGKFIKTNMLPIASSAIGRNHPELTEKDFLEFITTESYAPLLNAFLGQSKADKVRVGEPFPVVMPGSPLTPPNTSLPPSTGLESAPASPAPLDGPGITSLKM